MDPLKSGEKFTLALDKVSLYIEQLNKLITKLLDTSKIQSGNIELHMDPFAIANTLKQAIENLSVAISSHQIFLTGTGDALVLGDEMQILQVINNLISNAIKYSPGSNKVEIHIDKVSDYIKISVTDYGMGINYKDKTKIFERFYRASDIQKKFPGLGIGKGTLWVESEPGEGSTFSFTLPIFKSENNVS